MLIFKKGNLFELVNEVDAIINTVNCVGVMGKGIALEFKRRYPVNFKEYKRVCKNEELSPGKMLIVKQSSGSSPKYIINFPTKLHWRNPSKLDYIIKGLDALRKDLELNSIQSVAMPALGCGNGGLDWKIVKPIIEQKLSDLKNVKIYIYEPTTHNEVVKKKTSAKPKIKITKSRGLLLLLIEKFNSSSFKQHLTYEEVNHLAFLAQSLGAKLNLNFKETSVGPYDGKLNKLLLALSENQFIEIEKTHENKNYIKVISKNFKQKKKILADIETRRLYDEIVALISGFETRDRIKVLTIVLWFYKSKKNVENNQIFDEVLNWMINEDLNYSKSLIIEALQRVEKFHSQKIENLSLNI